MPLSDAELIEALNYLGRPTAFSVRGPTAALEAGSAPAVGPAPGGVGMTVGTGQTGQTGQTGETRTVAPAGAIPEWLRAVVQGGKLSAQVARVIGALERGSPTGIAGQQFHLIPGGPLDVARSDPFFLIPGGPLDVPTQTPFSLTPGGTSGVQIDPKIAALMRQYGIPEEPPLNTPGAGGGAGQGVSVQPLVGAALKGFQAFESPTTAGQALNATSAALLAASAIPGLNELTIPAEIIAALTGMFGGHLSGAGMGPFNKQAQQIIDRASAAMGGLDQGVQAIVAFYRSGEATGGYTGLTEITVANRLAAMGRPDLAKAVRDQITKNAMNRPPDPPAPLERGQ